MYLLPPWVQRKILPSPACSTRDTLSPHLGFQCYCSTMTSCFRSAPWAHPLLLLSAAKTENMLAWNHSAVDQDWFQALVAAVDHRVHHLLSNQVHLQQDAQCRCALKPIAAMPVLDLSPHGETGIGNNPCPTIQRTYLDTH